MSQSLPALFAIVGAVVGMTFGNIADLLFTSPMLPVWGYMAVFAGIGVVMWWLSPLPFETGMFAHNDEPQQWGPTTKPQDGEDV